MQRFGFIRGVNSSQARRTALLFSRLRQSSPCSASTVDPAATTSQSSIAGEEGRTRPDAVVAQDPVRTNSSQEHRENLQDFLISAKPAHPADVFDDKPLALGRLVERVSSTAYRVKFTPAALTSNAHALAEDSPPPLTLEVGTRVKLFYGSREDGLVMGGIIVKINGNATYILLMENDEIELSVSPDRVFERGDPTKILYNARFLEVVEWLRSTVQDSRECEATAFILYYRGWRVDRLFLLEKADINVMTFLTRTEREGIMEKAQWERDHHNVVRLLHRERVKDRDVRYALSKYKGTISCISGILVVTYVFTANLRAYRKQQRSYQLKLAAETLARSHDKSAQDDREDVTAPKPVNREAEERKVRAMLGHLNIAHPRILVFTGVVGCGKSSLCRSAIEKDGLPALFVEVRDSEDTLRSVVKALGVHNVDVCGDLLDFVAEAFSLATTNSRAPLLVLKLRVETSLQRVYKEAIGLVSDRQVCHIVFEVPLESLTTASMSLPRLDFCMVPLFNRAQAFEYTQHLLDPLDLLYFIETVGTNSNDLDELYAAVRQRGVDAMAYTSLKVIKAMRRLHAAVGNDRNILHAIKQLASMPSDRGLPDDTVENFTILRHNALRDIVLYDPVHDRWMFTSHVFHTAARCL